MANDKPVDTLRNGRLKVTIWQNNNGKTGEAFFTANLTKSYQDSNEKWQETTQLTGNEVSRAGALLNQASKRIAELEIASVE